MAQTAALVSALKKQLKAHGKTYGDVATVLGLSEASVKRLFAEHNFTLRRLETVLTLMDMEVSDLIETMQRVRHRVEQLNVAQEEQIAGDIKLLLVAVSVINGLSFADLRSYYNLSEHCLIQKLAQLDRLKMIDLLANNRIKLRIAPNFRWLPNGPIQRFFLAKVEQDFFNTQFERETDRLLVLNGLCTTATNAAIQTRMEQLVSEISEMIKKDVPLALEKKYGNTLVLAIRQWQYDLFRPYVR